MLRANNINITHSLEPYTFSHILIPQNFAFNWELAIACTALIFSLVTLIYAIRQTKIAQRGVELTRKTIEQADTNRQIELLPKHSWIIHVHVRFESWIKDIQRNNKILNESIENNDLTLLVKLKSNITEAKQLNLRGFEKEMPEWLLELYLSGAQYYFAGIGKIGIAVKYNSLSKIDHVQHYLHECNSDLIALMELKKLLDGMIPKVIINTPASLSSNEFFVD